MNKRSLPFISLALLVLTAGGLLLTGCPSGEGEVGASNVFVSPGLFPALEEKPMVKVLVSLREIDAPIEEWTRELAEENAFEMQERALAVLTPDDFTLTSRYRISSAIAGYISRSGVEKLTAHPDVVAIDLVGQGGPDPISEIGELVK